MSDITLETQVVVPLDTSAPTVVARCDGGQIEVRSGQPTAIYMPHAQAVQAVTQNLNVSLDAHAQIAAPDPSFFSASCSADLLVGMCAALDVSVPPTDQPSLRPANPLLRAQMPAVGVVVQKYGNTTCQVRRSGLYLMPGQAYDINVTYGVGLDAYPAALPMQAQQSFWLQQIGLAMSLDTILLAITTRLHYALVPPATT